MRVIGGRARQHANDLAAGASLGGADGVGDRLMLFLRELHHQLPEAPPPPNEPPPPEKPPPKPPPPPPPQSEDPPQPPGKMIGPLRLPGPGGRPPPALRIKYQTKKISKRVKSNGKRLSMSSALSLRTLGFGCHSALSPESTLMMPST